MKRLIMVAGVWMVATAALAQQTTGDLTFSTSLTELYQTADRRLQAAPAEHKPLIAISTSEDSGKTAVNTVYVDAVVKAGGIPMLLPCSRQPELLDALLRQADALILTGGEDLHPLLFGEEPIRQLGGVKPHRDVYDLLLLRIALRQGVPVLGICRGEQCCNVGLGGTLYQDLPAQREGVLMHKQSVPAAEGAHSVTIEPDSYLYRLLGQRSVVVNSFHHQAVKEVAPGLKVSARAADGVIEAIEGFPTYNLLAVQFHPEHLVTGSQAALFRPLFQDLVERARKYAKNKQ